MEAILSINDSEVKFSVDSPGASSLDKNLKNNCNKPENQLFEVHEEVEVKRKGYCGNYTLIGRQRGTVIFIRHKCKTWGCGVCGPKKLKAIKHGVYREAHKHGLRRFLSLTLPGDYQGSFKDSVDAINQTWRKWREYLKRDFGGIKFIKFIEPQKRGVAHLHVLIDKYIPQSWISRTWQALGGGKICDIRAIDIHRVSGYVSKYLTKDLIGDRLGSYRRYSTSRGIKLLEKRERTEDDRIWSFAKLSIDAFWGRSKGVIHKGLGTVTQMTEHGEDLLMFEISGLHLAFVSD